MQHNHTTQRNSIICARFFGTPLVLLVHDGNVQG